MSEEFWHVWHVAAAAAAAASIGLRLVVRPNVVMWCDMSLSNYAKRKQTGELVVTPSPFGPPVPEGEQLLNLGGMTQ